MPPDAFPQIAPLIAAAKADGIDARAVLARVITDLFVSRELHLEAELVQFVALIEPLLRAVDTSTATAVARKLAAHAATPRTVLEALLAREDEASYETLRSTAALDLRTLDILAERGPRLVGLAIASRPSIAQTTARILVARDEATIDRALARPRTPSLPGDVVSILVMRGRRDPDLASLVLALPSLPFHERCSLFLQADPPARSAICAEATRRAFLTRVRPSPFARQDIDKEVLVLMGAGSERLSEALAELVGLPPGDAAAMVADSSGEALVLALRACGARPAPIVSLLLARGLHLSRSIERVFALDLLARETSGAAAATVLCAFAEARPRPTRHIAVPLAARESPERPLLPARGEMSQAAAFKRRERKR